MHYTRVTQADPKSVGMIKRLVSYDTTGRESTPGLIDSRGNYLDGFGAAQHPMFESSSERRICTHPENRYFVNSLVLSSSVTSGVQSQSALGSPAF